MSKLRIIFVVSLLILGVLLAFTLFRPITFGQKFETLIRESVIQEEDEWIIQINIINKEGEVTDYTIEWSTGGEIYNSKNVTIKNGRTFTNIHHVYPETVREGEINLTIYKEGEPTPFEQSTYYVRFD
jgi:hypothetical protein